MAEMVPAAESQAGMMADSPASHRDVLDRGVHIRPAHEQAAQAAAVLFDNLESALVLGPYRLSFTYHWKRYHDTQAGSSRSVTRGQRSISRLISRGCMAE